MGSKASDEQITLIRSVVGEDFSKIDIIRALHMANNDPSAAINIIFDTPHLRLAEESGSAPKKPRKPPIVSIGKAVTPSKEHVQRPSLCDNFPTKAPLSNGSVALSEAPSNALAHDDGDWWLLGSSELAGLSTCKGRGLRAGDPVAFSFPPDKSSMLSTKFPGRGRPVASCSGIVRFSSKEQGEIGRIPNEWARCLSSLVKDKKVKIEGCCKSAPDVLGIMDTILLSVSVYIDKSMFHKCHQTSVKTTNSAADESIVHPFPALFRLLGLTPFKKYLSLKRLPIRNIHLRVVSLRLFIGILLCK